ncbi:PKD domain-containing protein [Sphingobacterium gobiense]|nr:PKD domain-containing protein [Sphingobacterium gobiense]
MTRKFLYMILAIAVGFASCEKQETGGMDEDGGDGVLPKPTASFSYGTQDPTDPFTIQFTNSSTNLSESRWAFGDDSTSADVSPIHTFIKTGIFNVKLVTLNEEGFWAQREEIITISPSNLVQLIAARSGDELQVSYQTGIDVAQSEWFVKQPDGTYFFVSQEDVLSLELAAGQFAEAYVELTTPKGSKTRLDMTLTDVGIVTDLTNHNNTFTVSHENSGGKEAGEGSLKLIDNSITSKFLIFDIHLIGGPFHWQFEYIEPQVINAYTMTTGNDAPGRDPRNWELLASNDGENWVTLDTQNEITFPTTGGANNNGRRATYTYLFDNTTPYHYYRLQVSAVGSGNLFQMSEFRMLQLPQ